MAAKKHIPNFITLLNLLSGSLSIYFVMMGRLDYAAYMIFLAALFDFFDGTAARLLKVSSALGLQLDSLADVVSFGVAPAFILFRLIENSLQTNYLLLFNTEMLPFVALLIPLFAAYRLAKFNIDERQSSSFIGLPTPASGMLIASFPLIHLQLQTMGGLLYEVYTNTWFFVILSPLLSFLMVAELPLFGLKFKNLSWKENKVRFIFLALVIILLFTLEIAAIPFVVLVYLLLSLILTLVKAG